MMKVVVGGLMVDVLVMMLVVGVVLIMAVVVMMVVVVVMMKMMVTMMTARLKFGNFLHKIRTVWDNLRNELDELNGTSTVSVQKLIPISSISIKVLREFAIFSLLVFYESAGPIVVVGKKKMPWAMDTLGIDRDINTANFDANFCSII